MNPKPLLIAALATLFTTLVYAAEPISGAMERGTASLSPAERSQYATESLTEMTNARTTLERLDRTAHECVAERLPEVNTLIEASTEAAAEMDKFQSVGNTTRADTELRKISAALTKTRALMLQAKECAKDSQGDGSESRTLEGPSFAEEGADPGADGDPNFEFDVSDGSPDGSPYS